MLCILCMLCMSRYLWQKPTSYKQQLREHVVCSKRESIILDKLVDAKYRRPKYFPPDDPYAPYRHVDCSPWDYRPPKLLP